MTDPDSLRKSLLVHIKSEIQLIHDALERTEKDLKDSGKGSEKIKKRIESVRHFYGQTERLLNLLVRHTTDELIKILENAENNQ